ncbi:endopeptidase La [Candidatus Protochlamydia phocaeensis]|uniref:endopeptidase La n=1 Tax=Candidatus Protochlamydia phocaeensis TaxID=1414722 RepID=UPI0008389DFD|nr:endopeptidase La [Candidatus Protochlamydia phocaeensis]
MTLDSQTTVNPPQQFPESLPVLPLRGAVVFPQVLLPLVVGQTASIQLVDEAMRNNRLIFLVAQQNEKADLAQQKDLYKVGTISIIHRLMRTSDGSLRLMVQGLERARLVEMTASDPYFVGRIEVLPEKHSPAENLEGLRIAIINLLKHLIGLIEELSDEVIDTFENISDPVQLTYLVSLTIPFSINVRQAILELDPVEAKLQRLIQALQHEVAVREIGRKIVSETQERMSKAQRDYFLREQVRSIQQELGEGGEQAEVSELSRRLEEAQLPEEAKKEADRELSRLSTMPAASAEYGMIRSYLDWIAGLPWNKMTGNIIDVRHAHQVLNEDHYDLEKIKDRILEYLAVKRLRQERSPPSAASPPPTSTPNGNPIPASSLEDALIREPILCFVGPPGVGKTSLGQSIARALGRKFVRISLGGVHDEAEIRGHRRTYIGAMPGRIIQAVRRAGTRDAVIMLDEIDKVGSDWRGDPSSALLEVLDPAQNQAFVDNYLGVAFDLSQILFITTANTLDTISGPLLDRMEVLRLSGYTDEEKIHIAQQYLIPKQIRAHGLRKEEISFDPEAIRLIARGYTREAGVRNLDREIAAICRKVARELAEGRQGSVHITPELVKVYLRQPIFFDEVAERTSRPGVATGLAWTPTGGDVLFVEATMMASHHEQLILTGMLGDVMRESAQAALSFVRSNPQLLAVQPSIFEGKTFHLHVPAGAVPKDGPSAGVTMATALASLISNRLIKNDVAMTGEITLRGKVLPVGGIKEKVLAAHRAGIKTIILPRHNERDLEEVPKELRRSLQFVFADTIEDVWTHALELLPTLDPKTILKADL